MGDGTGRACRDDLPDNGESRKFFDLGLEYPNHLDPLQQISVLLQIRPVMGDGCLIAWLA